MPRGGPPSGEGANLTMFDGAELGKAIAAHPGDIEAALPVYEAVSSRAARRGRAPAATVEWETARQSVRVLIY